MSTPYLSTTQMIEVDRAMIEDYRIELIQMMENAGRNLAALSRARFLGGDPVGKRVVVLAGTGGNGGGAMVCARRLSNWGAQVSLALTKEPAAFKGVPGHQLDILRRMGFVPLSAEALAALPAADLVVDGVIGYSLAGAPSGKAAELIRWANQQAAPILSLDTPSGLDTSTGTRYEPAIQAAATMTLALPKEGLRSETGRVLVGELYLADISVPPGLYASPALGLSVGPLFAKEDIVRVW
jgi:NAD(P)H-hydrate epimerase